MQDQTAGALAPPHLVVIRRLPPYLLALVLAAGVLAACGERASEPPVVRPAAIRAPAVDVEAEEARAILRAASPALAAEAFRSLEARHYTVEVRFRELAADGEPVKRWQRRLERAPDPERGGETLLGEVLAGQGGALGLLRYVDPIEILLPEDPPYLRPGNGDYEYRLLPEREMDGRPVRGAQAARRAGVDEPVVLVRSWVDAVTGAPAAVEVVRSSSSMLLSEESQVRVALAADGPGAPLPLAAHVDAGVQFLAESPRRFVVDLALADLRPAP